MGANQRRVVITGLGLISPIGVGVGPIWDSLRLGRSGIGPIRTFPVDGLSTSAVGEVIDFQLKEYTIPRLNKVVRKSMKYMARDIQLAVAAAMLAYQDAKLDGSGIDPTRIGIDLGAGLMSTELSELSDAIATAYRDEDSFDYPTWGKESIPKIEPIWLLRYLPNMLACHISIFLDCQGPSNTITQGEAASTAALGEAYRIISRGVADVMISGGADSKIHPLSLVRMGLLDQLSRFEGPAEYSHRPFDRRRSGSVPAEGAAIVILEERSHAESRGAHIYGEILGFGSASDAYPRGGIDPEGPGTELAVQAALREAGLSPDEIGHVHAHGAATINADLSEARAFSRVFGPGAVPVTAVKGATGNMYSGSGSFELAASLLATGHGLIPPTVACRELDPECPLDVVTESPRSIDNPTFLTSNLTRYGQSACLVVQGESASSSTDLANVPRD